MNVRSEQPEHVGADFMTLTDFWQRFRHTSARVGDVNIHYVEGGEGQPRLLIPGWPQSLYAWRYGMLQLVDAGYRVIAVDPRGMSESDAPAVGYDLGTVAAELHHFAQTIGLIENGPIHVARHDVGDWIAQAWAADWPADIQRVKVLDFIVLSVALSNDIYVVINVIRHPAKEEGFILIKERVIYFFSVFYSAKYIHFFLWGSAF